MGARSLLDMVSEKLGEAGVTRQVTVSVDKCPGARKNDNLRRIEREDGMATLSEVIKGAMSLDIRDRAALAEKLLASLEEVSEDEAERLWAEESQRRLDQYRAGEARAVLADEVHAKVNRLLR
jgi:Putative addiction module component